MHQISNYDIEMNVTIQHVLQPGFIKELCYKEQHHSCDFTHWACAVDRYTDTTTSNCLLDHSDCLITSNCGHKAVTGYMHSKFVFIIECDYTGMLSQTNYSVYSLYTVYILISINLSSTLFLLLFDSHIYIPVIGGCAELLCLCGSEIIVL